MEGSWLLGKVPVAFVSGQRGSFIDILQLGGIGQQLGCRLWP